MEGEYSIDQGMFVVEQTTIIGYQEEHVVHIEQ
jgi:hypothetical protein